MKKAGYIIVGVVLMALSTSGQDAKKLLKEGNDNLEYDHFRKASMSFEKALELAPQDPDVLFNLGRAYLGSFRHQEGLEKMEEALSIKPSIDKHQDYWLGKAYHLNYFFDKAITHYSAYRSTIKSKKDTRYTDLTKYIEECNYGKEYLSKQSHYKIENVGEGINTGDIEHSPVVSQDGKTMMFTSRHYFENGNGEEEDDEFKEQILISTKDENGDWSKPLEFDHNLNGHDATVQLFDEDSKLLIYRNTGAGDLYISESTGDGWLDPEPFNEVNTQWNERDAYISADGNTVVFSSSFQSDNHDGTTDLFIMTKEGSGKWSNPISIGDNINTKFDENAPFVSTDGKVLFFSSNGHSSMGGYDVFKCLYDEATESWSDPINLGYPLNTPGDDIYFYYSNANNWSGYFSSYRREGFGEKDIYEVTFVPNVFVKGTVKYSNTGELVKNVHVEFIANGEVEVMSSDNVNESEEGKYIVNVLADNSYSILVKSESGQTLATFEYEIGTIKEGDPLEYVYDLEISEEEPELITENRNEATSSEDTPVSIINEEGQIAAEIDDLNESQNTNTLIPDNAGGNDTASEDVSSVDQNETLAIQESNEGQPSEGKQLIDDTIERLSSNEKEDTDIEESKVHPIFPSNSNKVAMKEYFKMNDVETGCKRILHHVYFDFNKTKLKEESFTELSKLSCLMNTVPNIVVEIGGHTDDIGEDGYNRGLSQKRAEAVVAFLISQGVPKDRLSAVGYGEATPLASNDDEEEGRELNRRTEFKILSTGLSSAY